MREYRTKKNPHNLRKRSPQNPRSDRLVFGVCLDLGDRRISDLRSLGFQPVYPDRALASYRPFQISPLFDALGGKIKIPPVFPVTSTLSFLTRPVLSKISLAAEITCLAFRASGLSRTDIKA